MKTKRYLQSPERKRWGWSPYMEEILVMESPSKCPTVVAQETIISGKKLCFRGKFIWDYQIEVIDNRKFITSR